MQRNKFRGLYELNKNHRSDSGKNSLTNQEIIEVTSGRLQQTDTNDSLEYIRQADPNEEPRLPKNHHTRSHSCPFDLQNQQTRKTLTRPSHFRSPSAIPEEMPAIMPTPSLCSETSMRKPRLNLHRMPFAKKNSSQSLKSVVIHNHQHLDSNSVLPSSMLYSQKKIAEELQKKPAIKKASKKNLQKWMLEKYQLNQGKYLRVRLEQQMKKFQLSQDLQRVEKEATDITIKQSVLQNILAKVDQKYANTAYLSPSQEAQESSIVFY